VKKETYHIEGRSYKKYFIKSRNLKKLTIMETKNKITPEIIDRLEWYDMGDGIEFELWIDTKTEILYRVPIEIVRDFDNADVN